MLKDFQAGDKIRHIVLIKVQKIGPTSTGGMFARGILQDNSGMMNFICFEGGIIDKLRKIEGFAPVMVTGLIDINKFANDGSFQIVINKVEDVLESDDTTHLVPQANIDIESYKAKLREYVDNLQDAFLKKLMRSIFNSVYDKFVLNPAGSRLHHAYVGGLLEHCVDVTNLAVAMSKASKGVNLDLVVCGSLLHDLGKIEEISSEYGFGYTTKGRLLGHITISAIIVSSHAEKIPAQEQNPELLQELLHILISHHGEQEKGSPIACATKESFIVHYADELNAVLNQFEGNENEAEWQFSKMINRNLYNPVVK